MNNRIEEAEGDYALPRLTEGFEGEVIYLSAREMNLWYQTYSNDGCEYRFRDNLEKKDAWLADKQYSLYKDDRWMKYVTKWLQKEKLEYIERQAL